MRTISHNCPSCGEDNMSLFYTLENAPVHSVLLLATREEALNFPCGNIRLGFCYHCGFITNVDFDDTLHEYSSRYEETQGFSTIYNEFQWRLAEYLIKRYDLHRKKLIEIGCGKGEFLILMCEMGENYGVGFDPAYVPGRLTSPVQDQVLFIKDFYSEKYANYSGDFVCCKMTLEHIHNVAEFVSTINRSFSGEQDTIVFFQVPDVSRVLKDIAFWDIYYEHCSYFSPGSLARLFRRTGFELIDLWKDFGDQYLMIEARPSTGRKLRPLPKVDDLQQLEEHVAHFSANYEKEVQSWQAKFQEMHEGDRRIVLWGGGSKAVAFLTTLGLTLDNIEFVVDINPRKAHTYIAGMGQEIVPPQFLQSYKPDAVIVMNAIYQKEIKSELEEMGLAPKVICV